MILKTTVSLLQVNLHFARSVWKRYSPHAVQSRGKSAGTFAATFARISTGAKSASRTNRWQMIL